MKITIEENGENFTYDSGYDCSMQMAELTEKLYGLCVAAGYHPDSVGECFYDKGKDATEHLFKDDQVTSEDIHSDDNIAETIGYESLTVKGRYGEERIFKISDDNSIEYSFKDTRCVRYASNDDGSLALVDPPGGPCVSVGMDLGDIHKRLEGFIVIKINAYKGSHYLRVRHEK
jgi:hypothetical protein